MPNALRDEPDFCRLATRVHAQDILLDAMVAAVFEMASPPHRRHILAQARASAAAVGRQGGLAEADAVYKADVKVMARHLLERKLDALEDIWTRDDTGGEAD